jgi:hypothetical protein
VLFAAFAQAQQIDVLVSGSSLFATKSYNASEISPPPAERGGVYPGFGLQYILDNHFGVNAEMSFRYDRGIYDSYQPYRPIFYDFNGVFAPTFTKKWSANMMAGVGVESLYFYNQYSTCSPNSVCRPLINSSHFMVHLGAGPRYYFYHHMFVRPEAHYYFIPNNVEFHSDHLFRLGASVGYTFGAR